MLNVKKEDDKWEKPTDLEKEEKMLKGGREACYANRALCNLELSKSSPSLIVYVGRQANGGGQKIIDQQH